MAGGKPSVMQPQPLEMKTVKYGKFFTGRRDLSIRVFRCARTSLAFLWI